MENLRRRRTSYKRFFQGKQGVRHPRFRLFLGTKPVFQQPARANTQVRRQNGLPGNEGRYKARVVKQIPEGPGARQKILDWEIANTNKNGATLDPKIHKLPKPQQ